MTLLLSWSSCLTGIYFETRILKLLYSSRQNTMVSRDTLVVTAQDSWSKGRAFESLQERQKNFLLRGQLSVPALISVSVSHICYSSFPGLWDLGNQKCRWQVTAKHACTLRIIMALHEVTWHGAWLYGVHRTRRDGSSSTCHQSRNNQTAL